MLEKLNLLKDLLHKQKLLFVVGIVFILGIIIYSIYQSNQISQYTDLKENESMMRPSSSENNTSFIASLEKEVSSTDSSNEKIIVHVAGHVLNPGIVHLSTNARINDAIEAAGGATSEADLANINLAYPLEDGQKLYIPSKEEILKAKKDNEKVDTDMYITEKEGNTVFVEEQESFIISPSSIPSSSNPAINKKGRFLMVNINKATRNRVRRITRNWSFDRF